MLTIPLAAFCQNFAEKRVCACVCVCVCVKRERERGVVVYWQQQEEECGSSQSSSSAQLQLLLRLPLWLTAAEKVRRWNVTAVIVPDWIIGEKSRLTTPGRDGGESERERERARERGRAKNKKGYWTSWSACSTNSWMPAERGLHSWLMSLLSYEIQAYSKQAREVLPTRLSVV